jgi:hypothetical protein
MVERSDEKCFCDPLFMTDDDGSVSGDHVVLRRGDERYFCNYVIRLDEKLLVVTWLAKEVLHFLMERRLKRFCGNMSRKGSQVSRVPIF